MSKAPWTQEQVDALNRWQACEWIHPFTCGNRGDGHHKQRDGQDLGQLVATPEGWICPDCDYKQDWAHDMMFNAPPENPLKRFVEDK